jgi:malonate decarboxylase gamma subunit
MDDRGPDSRGKRWLRALVSDTSEILAPLKSLLVCDAVLFDEPVRYIAVVPNPENRFARARNGEVGLDEAWTLAKVVREIAAADEGQKKRAIIAIVDVNGQAYGRREESLGLFLGCAAAVAAYATARLSGHPVVSLIVGHAFSGGFLAHGYQANRILAVEAPEVVVHAMGKSATARVTRRDHDELDKYAGDIIPMACDIQAYAKLGTLHKLIRGVCGDSPTPGDVQRVLNELKSAIVHARAGSLDLSHRLDNPEALESRKASLEVRRRLTEQWNSLPD